MIAQKKPLRVVAILCLLLPALLLAAQDDSYFDDGYLDESYGDDYYGDDSYFDDGYFDENYDDEGLLDYGYLDADYISIGENFAGIYSLYLPSVEVREHYSGKYVVGWIRWSYNSIGATTYAKDGVKAHHSMELLAANPKARQIQTISFTAYDNENRVISRDSGSFNFSAWEDCVPGSNGESVWMALMIASGYRQQPQGNSD